MSNKLSELSSLYTWDSFVFVVVGSAPVSAIGADGKRVGLLFSNGGTGAIQVNFGPTGDVSKPIHIFPDKNPTLLKFSDVGPLVQQALTLLAPGTAGVLSIYTIKLV